MSVTQPTEGAQVSGARREGHATGPLSSPLTPRTATVVFLAFACVYFLSALIRAITATLSPVLSAEFALHARDLGLLAGGYFLGFAMTQLPLGSWLDRFGPRRVALGFLVVAVLGCLAFAQAHSFGTLLLARVLCGVGLSACLMAPLTGFRRWMSPSTQLRANAWMLMTGSLGMVASTLPVQWLLPVLGWRTLFLCLAAALLIGMAVLHWCVPVWRVATTATPTTPTVPAAPAQGLHAPTHQGYGRIWRDPYFRSLVPMGFFSYGGLLAVQTLWAAPWMVEVAHYSPLQAATGLFWINIAMLGSYCAWGLASPVLARRGLRADVLVRRGLPLSFVVMLALLLLPESLVGWSGLLLALFCMASTFVTPMQSAVGLAFGPELAGRALSAYNLVVFLGVFVIQWGIGLGTDALVAVGLAKAEALRCAFAALLLLGVGAFVYFHRGARHNGRPMTTP